MMRIHRYALPLALALVLPLTASAFGRRGAASDCNECGGTGGKGGKLAGLLNAIAASNTVPDYSGRGGFGFFQPPFQAAPWYLYWPYDQHFQLPAPIGAPYYPPQNLHTPWSPYYAHPALSAGGGPAGFAGGAGFVGDPRLDPRGSVVDPRIDPRNDPRVPGVNVPQPPGPARP